VPTGGLARGTRTNFHEDCLEKLVRGRAGDALLRDAFGGQAVRRPSSRVNPEPHGSLRNTR
jgi:hypothetical protein